MADYAELVKNLRITERICRDRMDGQVMLDAADAIEELQAAVAGYEATTDVEFVKEDGHVRIRFVPKWIPVTERLPKEKVEVLISDNTFFGGPIVAVAYWERGKCEWRDDMSTASTPHPTHWMPLPEPQKEET